MQLHELKKAKPVTTKSSGTDDPSKYVGGWEEYTEPQGINDQQDPKILAMEVTEDDGVKSLYHVTFTKHASGILKKGLEQFQPSNWTRRDADTRYNEDAGIFAFEHPADAITWANKMQYEFQEPNISIVRINMTDAWSQDPSDDIGLQMGKGRSMRSQSNISPSDIVKIYDLKDFGNPMSRDMSRDEWVQSVSQTLTEADQWQGKNVVWSGNGYKVAVDDPEDATYITTWTDDNERIGFLSTRSIPGYSRWLSVGRVHLDRPHRGNRLGLRMYQALLQYMRPEYKGIAGYGPDRSNKREVPKIYRRLGGRVDPNNADVTLIPRQTFFESGNSYGPQGSTTRFGPEPDVGDELDVGAVEKKEIRKSKKAPKRQVRLSARALSARGKPPRLDPDKVNETIRRPFLGDLTAEYEIIGEDSAVIGYAKVEHGKIEHLDYDDEANQEYRGQIISSLLTMITTEADRSTANLSIVIGEMTVEIKYLLERFGFRSTSGSVMKRNAGSIRPPNINPPQGMVNRVDEGRMLNEMKLERMDLGMGLSQYSNAQIGLVGGFRSGNSSPGSTRLKYDIYNMAKFDPANTDTAKAGYVELFVSDDNKIIGIVNIVIDPSHRGTGIGKLVIESLVDTVNGPFRIHDIKPGARGFWDKMGIQYLTKSQKDGFILPS